MGVRVSETNPETRIEMLMVSANSLNNLPTTPPMKMSGMNTAASDSVIDKIVKPTSADPWNAAAIGAWPASMCRTMFSSMTIASSTTNPTARVSAISERLSRLKLSRYIIENVPTIAIGSVKLGMIVATTLRRNKKMTSTTSISASSSENFTSWTAPTIDTDRSNPMLTVTVDGSSFWISAILALTALTTSTVFVPGCRVTARKTVRAIWWPFQYQAAALLFCTSSMTLATSPNRTGAPFLYVTMRCRNCSALYIWPVA